MVHERVALVKIPLVKPPAAVLASTPPQRNHLLVCAECQVLKEIVLLAEKEPAAPVTLHLFVHTIVATW